MEVELESITNVRDGSTLLEPVSTQLPLHTQDASQDQASGLTSSTTANEPTDPTRVQDAGEVSTAGMTGPVEDANEYPKLTKLQLQLIMVSLSITGFLASLDMTIVATAMPTIASEFNALSQQSWIALSFLLTSAVTSPVFGRATDLFGCRAMLFLSLFIFELGSLLCALAKNFIWLCCARAIAGLGGSGIIVVITIIVSQIVPLRERGNYMGIIFARTVVATVSGPLLGGLFVSFDWRWCFWINLIIAVPALAVLLAFVRKLPHTTKPNLTVGDLDFGGVAIMAVSVVSICLAFNWGGVTYTWNSKIVIALLTVGFALVPLFVAWEMKVPRTPLIPMEMFRFRNVTASTANNFFTAVSLQGIFLFLPSYYQIVRHDKQIISGLEVLPYLMSLLLTTIVSGFIISKTGSVRTMLWIGGLINLIGTGLLIILNGQNPRAVEYVLLVITGIGAGFLLQSSTISAQSQVPRDLLATATTMAFWSRSMGGILGVAMQGSIITNIFKRGILASTAAAPYVTQLLQADNVDLLPADVQVIAAQSYGAAFQMMMIATTVFCAPGFLVSLSAKKMKLS